MTCIEKIYSVSALVGTGRCNANCSFCAGKPLRVVGDEAAYERSLEAAIKLSARHGGWSLSLTGAGEPTCEPEAVTRALEIYKKCADQGAWMPNGILFTNGILFGDPEFCDKWLSLWKSLGLTNVAVSVHSTSESHQGTVYGVGYPAFPTIFENIKRNGVGVRATLLLSDKYVFDADSYSWHVNMLISMGVRNITSWPVGNPDGTRNEYTISRMGLFGIRRWLNKNTKVCHGHAWGGGVFDYEGSILRLTSYVTKHDPKKDYVRQLVVFKDGTVAYSLVKEGALCLK